MPIDLINGSELTINGRFSVMPGNFTFIDLFSVDKGKEMQLKFHHKDQVPIYDVSKNLLY